jgi:hypothetical protein
VPKQRDIVLVRCPLPSLTEYTERVNWGETRLLGIWVVFGCCLGLSDSLLICAVLFVTLPFSQSLSVGKM